MKTKYILFSILLLSFNISNAQLKATTSNVVNELDTVMLCLGDHTGIVQWQRSFNNSIWTDILGENDDTLLFIADQTSYIRASAKVGACDPYISDTSEIIVIPNVVNIEGKLYESGRFVYGNRNLAMYKLCNSDLIKKGTNLKDDPDMNLYASLNSEFNATNIAVKDLWLGYYNGLTLANRIIETVEYFNTHKEDPRSEDFNDAILGEAYFFRAYLHKSLIERWDNIVLLTTPYNYPQEAEIASRNEVYSLIVSDLDTAIILLPEAFDFNNKIKVTKGVARHLLSLVHMDIGNWAEAADNATQVINDPAYTLLPVNQLSDIFSIDHQDNSEIIFSWHPDISTGQYCSCDLFPLYDRLYGVKRSFEQGGRPFARIHPSDYYWTLFEKNDPRLEAWHKRYWIYDTDTINDPLPDGVNIGDTVTVDNGENILGWDNALLIVPTVTKYWEDNKFGRLLTNSQGYRNIIQYRVSQAYLIAAEAYLHLGNTASAQLYLDNLRTARGLTSINATIENILDEHARELGLEGHRFPMLKRLGILYDRVNANPDWTGIIQPYHVRWPIPQYILDITGLPQNEGY
jgi:starch-binding outer membrane protein, SusD/RagB family